MILLLQYMEQMFLYTDVWSSMGEENQKEEKDKDFNGFTIDQ